MNISSLEKFPIGYEMDITGVEAKRKQRARAGKNQK